MSSSALACKTAPVLLCPKTNGGINNEKKDSDRFCTSAPAALRLRADKEGAYV